MSTDADPLTTAELDALDALNRARTPGRLRPFAVDIIAGGAWLILDPPTDDASNRDNDAAVMVAAANALPALLAEVRASRERERIRETWQASDDDGPRIHIPRDLLTREGVRR
jgi:hypothetical protein